jgi:ABC-2 type transport system ATP-binding protein
MSATAATKAPLLVADHARIAIDGVTVIDDLSLTSRGDRVLLAGDASSLIAAITGVPRTLSDRNAGEDAPEIDVVAGSLAVAGRDVASRAHVPVIGAAPLDPPLPPKWSALQYVAWSARLAGASAKEAEQLANAQLARVGLGGAVRAQIAMLPIPERRALVLAQAAVLSPEVLVAEAPLTGLEGGAAQFVLAALAASTEKCSAIVSATRVDPSSIEGGLARQASYVVVLSSTGEVVIEGPPGELFAGTRMYALSVRSNAELLRIELASRGIDLRGGPARFTLALPIGATTREVLAAAGAARAPIVEMIPILE